MTEPGCAHPRSDRDQLGLVRLTNTLYDGVMTIVNVQEAKTRLSALLVQVEQGEDIQIARAGTVVARLVPAVEPPERTFGTMSLEVPADFDEPLPEDELAAWE